MEWSFSVDCWTSFENVFQLNQGPNPPAMDSSLNIQVKPGATQAQYAQRIYATDKVSFTNSTIRNVE